MNTVSALVVVQIISTVGIAAGWYATFLSYNLGTELDRRSEYSDVMSRTLAGTCFAIFSLIAAVLLSVAVWTSPGWLSFGLPLALAAAYVGIYRPVAKEASRRDMARRMERLEATRRQFRRDAEMRRLLRDYR